MPKKFQKFYQGSTNSVATNNGCKPAEFNCKSAYLSLVATRLNKNCKIPNLMRNFMKKDRKSGDYTKITTHKKWGSNG